MDPNLNNAPPQVDPDQFGITEEEAKSYRVKGILARLSYYWQVAEPTVIKIFNTLVYTAVKFIKGVVTSMLRMAIKGG